MQRRQLPCRVPKDDMTMPDIASDELPYLSDFVLINMLRTSVLEVMELNRMSLECIADSQAVIARAERIERTGASRN